MWAEMAMQCAHMPAKPLITLNSESPITAIMENPPMRSPAGGGRRGAVRRTPGWGVGGDGSQAVLALNKGAVS